MKESLYDVLEVSRTASHEVIRAAYKSLVQRYHPDKNPDNPEAESLLKLINNAYETLSDPERRASYDLLLTLEGMAAPESEKREEEKASKPQEDHEFEERWDLYQAFIGRNPSHYRSSFKRFHHQGKTSRTFNWSALLAGGAWAAYRKLYGLASIHLFLLASGVLAARLLEGPIGLSGFLPFLVMSIWLSLEGDARYYLLASKKITEIADQETDNAAIFGKLHLIGGVNMLAPFIFAGLAVIFLLASRGISPPAKQPVPRPALVIQPPKPAKPVAIAPPVASPPAVLPMPTLPPPELPAPNHEEKPQQKALPKPERHVEKPKKQVEKPKEVRKPVEPESVQPERPAPLVQKYADLATAVSAGDRTAVLQLIKQGEDVNLVRNNQIPLIIAVKNGDIEMVRLLLSHGADVNQTDSQGNTAMIYAKVRADAKMIELLKHAGAKNPFN